ncbi:peptidyl-prolyl cis-trans isomerase [Paenibacillus psychroresistens]|uniref:Peptidyl-prolyl cis-trans isomerase n=1 Tax=Paenibacillus psychroresistens TaxID=1778678 RepID=A0A6B8RSF2_9BACL|nr:peptidylprolyl isomerase [Paenibacillus psychroresistens]QGQ98837.1 peptidyl-prolyl cis-trans isomerase [Paenibacillus psychroresistens]
MFRKANKVVVQKIAKTYLNGKGIVDDTLKLAAKQEIDKLRQRLEQGEDFEVIWQEWQQEEKIKKEEAQQELSEASLRTDLNVSPKLRDIANLLKQDEVSQVFDEPTQNAFYIIRCIQKVAGGYKLLKDIKSDVEHQFEETSYISYMDKEVGNSQINFSKDGNH